MLFYAATDLEVTSAPMRPERASQRSALRDPDACARSYPFRCTRQSGCLCRIPRQRKRCGEAETSARSRDGKQILEHAGVFTHVYQQVRGEWRCVSAHWTALQAAPKT